MSGENESPGVVFDCVVFIQAAANERGPSGHALDLVETGEVKLFVSNQILLEIRSSLSHPRVRQKLPGITDERVEALLKRLDKLATPIAEVPRASKYPRDPKDEPYVNLAIVSGNAVRVRRADRITDEPYVNLAIVSGAKYLVSRDNDLLDLMRVETKEAQAFRRVYPMLTILNPVAFLHKLRE